MMTIEQTHYLNMFLGLGAFVLQIISVVVIILLVVSIKTKKSNAVLAFISQYFVLLGFLLSFSAGLFSLFYSEVLKFPPCVLCWYARIFMYPQIFLFAIAMWVKDRKVLLYAFPLTLAGFALAIYHNFGYYFGETTNVPCDASGVSCYQHLVSEFGGYISIPMLSLTSVVAVLTVLLVAKFYNHENTQ